MQRSVMCLLILWFEFPPALSSTVVLLAGLSHTFGVQCRAFWQYCCSRWIWLFSEEPAHFSMQFFTYIWLDCGQLTWFSSQDSAVISSQGVGKNPCHYLSSELNHHGLQISVSLKVTGQPMSRVRCMGPWKIVFLFPFKFDSKIHLKLIF